MQNLEVDKQLKSIILSMMFLMIVPTLCVSQTLSDDLRTARSIRLLSAEKSDIDSLLKADSPFSTDTSYSRQSAVITVSYSSGKCTIGDAYKVETDDWNVSAGKAVQVSVQPKDRLTIDEIGIDVSKLKKEKLYRGVKSHFIYFDKKAGMAVAVHGRLVDNITYFPSAASNNQLCNDPKIRKYYSRNQWHRDPEPKYVCVLLNYPPDVKTLEILKTDQKLFEIRSTAEDPEGDVVTYNYITSAGTIIGSGPNVKWDLSGVGPGTYSITVAADDGCGICGKYLSKTVTIQ